MEVALLEPGSVSSGALDAPLRYFAESDVYGGLDAQVAKARGAAITVEEAATVPGRAHHVVRPTTSRPVY